MYKRVCSVVFVLTLCAPACALADQSTSVGVELAGAHGEHRESGGSVTAPLVPAPIVTASHRMDCWEVAAEGLPPIGPIPIGKNGLGMQNIVLTYADATLRYWNRQGTLAAGIGETLYNQRTVFLGYHDRFTREQEVDHSRIAGTRYELVGRLPLNARYTVEAQIAVNPAMHGRYSFTQSYTSPGLSETRTSSPNWERASQVDADARVIQRFGSYAISYGVRYLNYTAAYTGWLVPRFADANSIVMPYVGVERFFGDGAQALHTRAGAACLSHHTLPAVEVFAGADLTSGEHKGVTAGAVRGTLAAPAPFFRVRARQKRYELMAESMQFLRSAAGIQRGRPGFTYSSDGSYDDITLRYRLHGNTAVGIGDALYVAQTHLWDGEREAVRAAGLRYEVLQGTRLNRDTRMLLGFALSPSMHQRTSGWINGVHASWPASFGKGTLVDGSVEFQTARGAGHSWIYGLRYLNYASGHGRQFGGARERTGGVAAFAAWGFSPAQ